MKEKRAIITTGARHSEVIRRGPIRTSDTSAVATSLARPDLEKLKEHYKVEKGYIASKSDALFRGETDEIFA